MNIDWLQILSAALGALGFALIYQIRGGKLIAATLGGGLSWLVYLLAADAGLSDIVSMLAASVFASVYAEIMARIIRAPTTVFYVPAVIPLVPGSSLYYTMTSALHGDWAACGEKAWSTLGFAAAIAGGILVVISVRSIARSLFGIGRKSI